VRLGIQSPQSPRKSAATALQTRKKDYSQSFQESHFSSRQFFKRSKINISEKREVSFGTLNELRKTWIVASGLEHLAETPPGYDSITLFAQPAQADIEQAKLRRRPLCLFRDEAPPLPEIEA
jgi:hypothetical protein